MTARSVAGRAAPEMMDERETTTPSFLSSPTAPLPLLLETRDRARSTQQTEHPMRPPACLLYVLVRDSITVIPRTTRVRVLVLPEARHVCYPMRLTLRRRWFVYCWTWWLVWFQSFITTPEILIYSQCR